MSTKYRDNVKLKHHYEAIESALSIYARDNDLNGPKFFTRQGKMKFNAVANYFIEEKEKTNDHIPKSKLLQNAVRILSIPTSDEDILELSYKDNRLEVDDTEFKKNQIIQDYYRLMAELLLNVAWSSN